MEDSSKKTKDLCKALYALLVLGALLQFTQQTVLIGMVALLAAAWIATKMRKKSQDSLYQNHFHWIQRTFWIGSGVLTPIAIIISTILILAFTNVLQELSHVSSGAVSMDQVDQYMQNSMDKISLYIMATSLPTLAWWLRRCWVGYRSLRNEKPIEKVMSWL